jgi:hypothetical protein
MSAVLDRGGLQQRWVAVNLPCFWMFPDIFFSSRCQSHGDLGACQVYPPGDPLNLHFDPMQLPRDGSPQVGHAANRCKQCRPVMWSVPFGLAPCAG